MRFARRRISIPAPLSPLFAGVKMVNRWRKEKHDGTFFTLFVCKKRAKLRVGICVEEIGTEKMAARLSGTFAPQPFYKSAGRYILTRSVVRQITFVCRVGWLLQPRLSGLYLGTAGEVGVKYEYHR